jgi:hypothetical protein
MDEMQLLEEFRAVVAPPDPGTLAQARARVLAGAPAGRASRRGPPRSGIERRSRASCIGQGTRRPARPP